MCAYATPDTPNTQPGPTHNQQKVTAHSYRVSTRGAGLTPRRLHMPLFERPHGHMHPPLRCQIFAQALARHLLLQSCVLRQGQGHRRGCAPTAPRPHTLTPRVHLLSMLPNHPPSSFPRTPPNPASALNTTSSKPLTKPCSPGPVYMCNLSSLRHFPSTPRDTIHRHCLSPSTPARAISTLPSQPPPSPQHTALSRRLTRFPRVSTHYPPTLPSPEPPLPRLSTRRCPGTRATPSLTPT